MSKPNNTENPENWYWAVFYYNPADPTIWVPKRYGFGWTLNFANKWSWVIMACIVVAAILPYFFIQ